MPDDITLLTPVVDSLSVQYPITVELVQQAVAWDKRKRVLAINNHVRLKNIAEGQNRLAEYNMPAVRQQIDFLIRRGFDPVV